VGWLVTSGVWAGRIVVLGCLGSGEEGGEQLFSEMGALGTSLSFLTPASFLPFFFFCSTRDQTQGLTLARQDSTT
jgi:hypothetical protein